MSEVRRPIFKAEFLDLTVFCLYLFHSDTAELLALTVCEDGVTREISVEELKIIDPLPRVNKTEQENRERSSKVSELASDR